MQEQPVPAEKSETTRSMLTKLTHLAGIGVLQFAAAVFCLKLSAFPEHIPVVWIPSGITLSILLLNQRVNWRISLPVLMAGNFFACLQVGLTWEMAFLFICSDAIEGVLAAWLIQQFMVPSWRLIKISQLFGVAAICLAAISLAGFLSAALMDLFFSAPMITGWMAWFFADSLGIMASLPLILAWKLDRLSFSAITRSRAIEGSLMLTLLGTVMLTIFSIAQTDTGPLLSIPYLAYPLLFFVVYRFGALGAATANSLLAIIGLVTVAEGRIQTGSLVIGFDNPFFNIQIYLFISALFTLALAAVIHAQREAELELRQSERRIRSIFLHVPIYVGQIDPEDGLVFDNWANHNNSGRPGYQRQATLSEITRQVRHSLAAWLSYLITGEKTVPHVELDPIPQAAEKACGDNLASFCTFAPLIPDHVAMLQQAIQASIKSGRPWQSELAAEEQTRVAWFNVQLNPILADGRVECLILTAMEVTERKLAEEALRMSEERYSVAVRGANDGVWDWDLDKNKVYYSQRWKKILGYNDDEITSSPAEWLDRIHPNDFKQVREDLAAHQEGYTPHFVSEHRLKHKNGAYRWVLVRGLAVRTEGKKAHRLAGSLTDITARKSAEERLLHDAMHDTLTSLPNRAYFLDQLKRSIQRMRRYNESMGAVLLIDLDRFKLVNESFGHQAGDQLLVSIARRLEASLRPQDIIARFGGDEFAILLDDINTMEVVVHVANRIQGALAKPFTLQNQEVFTSASIGIVTNAEKYDHAEDLLRDADSAMYEAKANGRGCYHIFETNLRTRNQAKLQLENDLRRAQERQEFELYYMPIVALPGGAIYSLEALIRWNHPERGMVMPNDFIPVAEENGQIIPINEWVLRTACQQLKDWLKINPSIRVSVNLSARQLKNPNLSQEIAQVMAESGLAGSSLQLEITESAALEDFDQTVATLSSLNGMGIQISLDDFGKSYSSLDYLKRFPVSTIKIDKSFIWDIPEDGDDAVITRTIISVGHLLNKHVVAEGVETHRQLDFLHRHQCDAVQGYLYSQAKDVPTITNLLQSSRILTPAYRSAAEEGIE